MNVLFQRPNLRGGSFTDVGGEFGVFFWEKEGGGHDGGGGGGAIGVVQCADKCALSCDCLGAWCAADCVGECECGFSERGIASLYVRIEKIKNKRIIL